MALWPTCLQRTVIRICAAPGARWLIDAVAFERFRTAMGKDAGRLFWKMLRGERHQWFERDLVAYMLTLPDLAYVPLFLSHTAPPDYAGIV